MVVGADGPAVPSGLDGVTAQPATLTLTPGIAQNVTVTASPTVTAGSTKRGTVLEMETSSSHR
jgi:hypothetical protein